MASIGHIAVGMLGGRVSAKSPAQRPLWKWMVAFTALSMFPDADVIGYWLGIPYRAPFGHRGATHSLIVAVIGGLIFSRLFGLRGRRLILLSIAVLASHGLLDALTDGGIGVEFFWPFSYRRFFLPFRFIPVAPIGGRLFSRSGIHVMLVESLASVPLVLLALVPRPKIALGIIGALICGVIAVSSVITIRRAMQPADLNICDGYSLQIVVRSQSHRLALCEAGKPINQYFVRLGWNGMGKTKGGDLKTPVGTYSLAKPVVTHEFGRFIPVGYPTPSQKSAGYTGAAIGVHGPHRIWSWVGPLNNAFDVSSGCIGLSSDREITEISEWVTQRGVGEIDIR